MMVAPERCPAGCSVTRGRVDYGIGIVLGQDSTRRYRLRQALQQDFRTVIEIGGVSNLPPSFEHLECLVATLHYLQSTSQLTVEKVIVMGDLLTVRGYHWLRQIFPKHDWAPNDHGDVVFVADENRPNLWGVHLNHLSAEVITSQLEMLQSPPEKLQIVRAV